MAKFTIITDVGNGPETPGEAIDFPNAQAAIEDAQVAIAEMARDVMPNGKRADFAVKVANEDRKAVYEAEMHFVAKTAEDLTYEKAEADAAAPAIADALAKGSGE
jgi:uncharacterized protein YbaA (DUF1428 family)